MTSPPIPGTTLTLEPTIINEDQRRIREKSYQPHKHKWECQKWAGNIQITVCIICNEVFNGKEF